MRTEQILEAGFKSVDITMYVLSTWRERFYMVTHDTELDHAWLLGYAIAKSEHTDKWFYISKETAKDFSMGNRI